MKAQEYFVTVSDDDVIKAMPAQMVYDSDEVIGFVSEVDYDNNQLKFTLFESTDITDDMMNVVEELSSEEIQSRLMDALIMNPDMTTLWKELAERS